VPGVRYGDRRALRAGLRGSHARPSPSTNFTSLIRWRIEDAEDHGGDDAKQLRERHHTTIAYLWIIRKGRFA